MKYRARFRLLAASLMTVLLLANVPSLQATALQDSGPSFQVKHDKWKDNKWKDKKNTPLPEGSAGGILILAAGSLGGAVLIWRRKRRAIVA